MVLLSTHNICFGSEINKLFFCYALVTKGLELKEESVPNFRKFTISHVLASIVLKMLFHGYSRQLR